MFLYRDLSKGAMTEQMKALRVHIGPVQGFIRAGRRTRDFWAGSFLLSRLAGQAMYEVEREVEGKRGRITIPVLRADDETVKEQTFLKITAAEQANYQFREPPAGPLVGTLVNHFRATVPGGFDAGRIRTAVEGRFQKLRDNVFKIFIEPALDEAVKRDVIGKEKRSEIEKRWDFQTSGSFFEVLYVSGPCDETDPGWQAEGRWLDRRKMWRSHAPPMETSVGLPGTGDRCPVHPEFCELGGFFRRKEREKQKNFWGVTREVVGRQTYYPKGSDSSSLQFINTLDLREGERLCGFALVKRLFPLLPPEDIAEAIGWAPDHLFAIRKHGWSPHRAQQALRNWPSTAFVAAIPWIIKVGGVDLPRAEEYAKAQYQRLGADPILKAERPQRHRVAGIDRLAIKQKQVPLFAILDGTLHFKRGLDRRRLSPDSTDALVRGLADEFGAFREDLGKKQFNDGPASPFYAMLEMDGDGMGKVFSVTRARAERGSRALLEFSDGVPAIVRDHDGVLIYAGADDVKAMLPIETAIPCALKLNEHWRQTMRAKFLDKDDPLDTNDREKIPTLSGSIVFADYQAALGDVYDLTHKRLENVAKDGMGRDALAIALLKSGGVRAEWASCWEVKGARTGGEGAPPTDARPVEELQEFAYTARAAAATRELASRLPYLVHQRFSEVLKLKEGEDEVFNDDRLAKFIGQEIKGSKLAGGTDDAEKRARNVVNVLRPYSRDASEQPRPSDRHIGGLLIARFLAAEGLWSYYDDWKPRASVNYDAWKEQREGGR